MQAAQPEQILTLRFPEGTEGRQAVVTGLGSFTDSRGRELIYATGRGGSICYWDATTGEFVRETVIAEFRDRGGGFWQWVSPGTQHAYLLNHDRLLGMEASGVVLILEEGRVLFTCEGRADKTILGMCSSDMGDLVTNFDQGVLRTHVVSSGALLYEITVSANNTTALQAVRKPAP
jgi:hypothetical protein